MTQSVLVLVFFFIYLFSLSFGLQSTELSQPPYRPKGELRKIGNRQEGVIEQSCSTGVCFRGGGRGVGCEET